MEDMGKQADLAIVGFSLPDQAASAEGFFDRMNAILERLPTTLLVHSARGFEGAPLLFDAEDAKRPSDPPPVKEAP